MDLNNTCMSPTSSDVTTQNHSSSSSSNIINVCIHLSLSKCPCSSTKGVSMESETSSSSMKNKKRHQKDETNGARKRARNNVETLRWGYSLDLMIYDDPWKIKKVLQKSDIGNMSRLLLPMELAENLVLPVLDVDERRDAETERGTPVMIWDVNTNSIHSLVFKRWGSSKSYVFIDKWVQDFVKRRHLKEGDEIGFHWDPYNHRFAFTLLGKHELRMRVHQ